MIQRRAVWCWSALLCLVPQSASAHLVSTRFGELYSGILHPILSLQHIVPWLGLGLLAGMQKSESARRIPWQLPPAVMLGVLVGRVLPESGTVTVLNLLSFVAFGALVALAARLNDWVLASVTVLFGLSHGFANAAPELDGGRQLLYALGVGISAHVVITLSTAAAHELSRRRQWGPVALRAAGSWIAAIGLIFGGFSLLGVS